MIRRAQIVVWVGALLGAVLVSSSAGQGPPPGAGPPGGSPPGLDKAIEVKQKHADTLLDKPGVVGVDVGVNPAGRAVIRIYKEKDDVADLPSELDGVPVESLETGVIEARAPTDRFPRPVPIGVSGGLADIATGTLGVRVTDGTNVYVLSNNHVLAGINSANIGDPITQPGSADGGTDPADRIGTLAAYQTINFSGGSNTMDAAIALTSTADMGIATPGDGYGVPSSVSAPVSLGLPVQKYGRTTGFQVGDVVGTNVSVDVCYLLLFEICLQEARFDGQFSISPGPFSAPGDSGSLVVTQGGNAPVGLLFAGGDGLTIATPIDLVLQRFGVTIEGQPPGDGPPSAPTSFGVLAGADSVSLSWNAPAFDGGSPITNYKVYRGTSSGSETFLANAGTETTYVDGSVTNGTTYYYKVSAENANGEGTLSAGASATPTDLVAPTTLVTVDDFNRGTENPLTDGGRWTNGVNGSVETGLNVSSSTLACSKTSTCTAWRNASQYGPDVEVWTKISALPGTGNAVRLLARLQGVGTSTYDGYMLRTNQLAGTDQVFLERVDNGSLVNRLTMNQELAAGDTLLLRVKGTTLEAWRHDGSAWFRLGVVQDTVYGANGYVGVGLRGTAGRVDDWGARSLTQNPPWAPTSLSAVAGADSVSLSWNAPAFDGGSPITNYKVYGGTSSGSETFLANAGTETTYVDGSVTNGTTYYYKVSAENANGEGTLSAGASATPTNAVLPEPLSTLDDFNRPNENPLSDANRWTNGVNGATGAETGLFTSSNTLACSRTTTCTAWRNASQYGPDVEVWTTISTLPGTNNHTRLYARLRDAGTSTFDGYMVRTNPLSSTDQVFLERVDNGTIVNRLTVNQELAVGDVLLLRVEGSTLEIWRKASSTWSRLGLVQDATYAAAGYAGVGIRGTVGRLDDFGARRMGAPPVTAPSAPQSMQATPGNAQVSLSWSAPSSTGGSPITSYTVYRGTSPSPTGVLASGVSTTSYLDSSAANGQTYYYRVTASNLVGESPYSNEVSATPTAPATAPSAPQSMQATPGNAQVSLSWSAPSSTGGSPITSYTVYRGTSPSPTGVLASGVSTTSYLDSSAANGQTYYYRVTASNLVGESPYSNEVSATPTAPATAPSAPQSMQATPGNAQVSLSWSAPSSTGGSPITSYTVYRGTSPSPTGVLASGVSTTSYLDSSAANGQTYYYRVTASNLVGESPYSNEVSATPTAPATAPSAPQSMQATPGNAQVSLSWSAPSSTGGSPITSYTVYRGTSPSPTGVLASGVSTTSYLDSSAANGQTYYYRVTASNLVGESPYSNEVSATPTAPATAPSAPQSMQATPGNAQVSLSWSAPSSTGGSPITSYTVYRGTSPSPTGVLASGVSTTSYLDSSAANGQTYYYRVTASNLVGESPYSNEVSATPTNLMLPIEPLPVLDNFNRGNENPLSQGGNWFNGIIGSSETGLRVTSNALACTKNTTCTAWRPAVQYANVEVSARVTTLPGNNNHIRLYGRIQQPGSGACDGYMLRTNQLSGTDQLFLERIDNGVVVTLATFSRDLAAGDTLLLRITGPTLEAWHRRGTTWTRVGTATDTRYGSAGYVGVGIRAKTGRLDDFGAR